MTQLNKEGERRKFYLSSSYIFWF